MGKWKTIAVAGLAIAGGWYLLQRFGGVMGIANMVGKGLDPVALQRFMVGAKAQQEAAKAAAVGGPKALADKKASDGMVKS